MHSAETCSHVRRFGVPPYALSLVSSCGQTWTAIDATGSRTGCRACGACAVLGHPSITADHSGTRLQSTPRYLRQRLLACRAASEGPRRLGATRMGSHVRAHARWDVRLNRCAQLSARREPTIARVWLRATALHRADPFTSWTPTRWAGSSREKPSILDRHRLMPEFNGCPRYPRQSIKIQLGF